MSLNIMQNGEESDLLSSLSLSFLYSCISRGYPDQTERRYAKVVNRASGLMQRERVKGVAQK